MLSLLAGLFVVAFLLRYQYPSRVWQSNFAVDGTMLPTIVSEAPSGSHVTSEFVTFQAFAAEISIARHRAWFAKYLPLSDDGARYLATGRYAEFGGRYWDEYQRDE